MKFRSKLTLATLCLLSLLFGLGGSLLISLSFRESLEREEDAAYSAYRSVLGILQLAGGGAYTAYEDLAEMLEALPPSITDEWLALRLADGAGTIYETGQSAFSPPEDAYSPGCCTIRCTHPAENQYILLVCGTLEAGGETLYLDMCRDVSAVFAARDTQLRAYSRVFALLAVLCALLSLALSYALTRPLTKLSEASRDLASGQLSRRVQIRAGDEIGRAALDFNAMADALERNISALEESVERQKRFTGSFAHEVKTPMTSIIGYADLIRGGTLDGEERRQAADFIFTEGRRLERLSQKLLQLQMLQNGEIALSAARPAALLEALAARWGPVYEAQGAALTWESEDGACLLEPELVKTLLINLWDNARKAGAARIETRAAMLPDGCLFTVRDDGQGIPPQALSHLTEAFYRVDKSRSRTLGGAGLGLSLCREIAALHGGELRFESEPGRGTAVTVDLRGGRV